MKRYWWGTLPLGTVLLFSCLPVAQKIIDKPSGSAGNALNSIQSISGDGDSWTFRIGAAAVGIGGIWIVYAVFKLVSQIVDKLHASHPEEKGTK